MFTHVNSHKIYLSRSDPEYSLSSFSAYSFLLDDAQWPTVEHYFQAMRFTKNSYRELIRNAETPLEAQKIAKWKFLHIRFDWKKVRDIYMTRAVYTKCLTHKNVSGELLRTGNKHIEDTTQYDYYWGRGRDGRGKNKYGLVLMSVRDKLLEQKN